MAPPKETPQAFMPSSNDSLHSPTYSSAINEAFPSLSEARSSSLTNKSAALSPLASPPQAGISSKIVEMTNGHHHAHLPGRQSVSSASQLPSQSINEEPSTWKDLYYEQISSFKTERVLWQKERDKLLREIQELYSRLGSRTGVSRSISIGGDGAPDIMTNEKNKVFYSQNTVDYANEKLRELSVVSGNNSEDGTPRRSSSISDDQSPLKKVTSSRLESISEDTGPEELSPRRPSLKPNVSFHEASDGMALPTIIEASPSPVQDEPLSPPQTARALSPPPANYTMHAGHTPLAPGSPSPKGQLPRPRHPLSKPLPIDAEIEDDGDKPLKEPMALPSNPDDATNQFNVLTSKLQDVEANPVENAPEAMRAISSHFTNGHDEYFEEETGESPAASNPKSPTNEDGPPGGIRLRVKRSMNFGAPLGEGL